MKTVPGISPGPFFVSRIGWASRRDSSAGVLPGAPSPAKRCAWRFGSAQRRPRRNHVLNWHDDAVSSHETGPGAATGVALLEAVRQDLAALRLPLALPGTDQTRLDLRRAVAQLDDYILPRYRSLDAPLLAVVGGSTGAGKSTLVNALVGHPVTRAGAIRPTTRQPILLHHPADAGPSSDRSASRQSSTRDSSKPIAACSRSAR